MAKSVLPESFQLAGNSLRIHGLLQSISGQKQLESLAGCFFILHPSDSRALVVGRARTASRWGTWFKGILSSLTQVYPRVGAGWHSRLSGAEGVAALMKSRSMKWAAPAAPPLPTVYSQPAQSHCCSQHLLLSSHLFPCNNLPTEGHPGRGSSGVCCLLRWVLGLCFSKQTPAFIPMLDPTVLLTRRKNGSIGASPFLWHYLWNKGETPALPHTWGLHPWPHAAKSPAGRHVSLAPMQIALPALFGRGERKVGRSDIGSSYLQLRNIRAVKLISWWIFPL